jgi:cbb3-type cytochrome oxidase maturation protein
MSVILLLIPLSVAIAAAFLAAFIWAVRNGQFEDTCTPSMRMLMDEPSSPKLNSQKPDRK